MKTEVTNIWIAEDPTQPGTAFATHSAADYHRAYVAEWATDIEAGYGVKPRLINKADGLLMLDAWSRDKTGLKYNEVQP